MIYEVTIPSVFEIKLLLKGWRRLCPSFDCRNEKTGRI